MVDTRTKLDVSMAVHAHLQPLLDILHLGGRCGGTVQFGPFLSLGLLQNHLRQENYDFFFKFDATVTLNSDSKPERLYILQP